MQILHSDFKKGIMKVMTQSLDDLWILYNIIKPNDIVGARTFRRVVRRDGDKGERKPMHLDLKTETVEFHEYSNRLRLKGKIIHGPDEYVSIGQYHTINVEVGTKIQITKEKWFRHEIERLEKSKTEGSNKIILAVALESGLSTIGLISNYSLSIASTIRHNIPGKRYSKQNFNLEMQKFLEDTTKVIFENVKNYQIQLVIICGPGFLKEQYQKVLREKAKNDKINLDIRAVSASTGTKSGLIEIIKKGEISSIISDHRISIETGYMEEFIERLGKDNGLFTYGLESSFKAAEMGAVEELLVTDIKMRSIGTEDNKELAHLFSLVEKNRGNIHIVSTLHPSGEQLESYGGIISLLRYKVQ
ncbi:MAG: mRNA surveillance protein pelota [archaeon]|nr:mRNA surveillance protein pelota [archaeon]